MAAEVTIDVGKAFTRYPAGRFISDGQFSGEAFRESFLLPQLQKGNKITVHLDGVLGYGSSFLEEAFGGLVRMNGLTVDFVLAHVLLETSDPSLREEIVSYIKEAQSHTP